MSKLCLTLTESSIKKNLEVIEQNRADIDLLELRLDYLDHNELNNLDDFETDIPTILTFRKEVDGGLFNGDENFRLNILNNGINSGNFDFIDLEENLIAPELEELAQEHSVTIIRSFHDFKGIPENLAQRLISCKRSENEIPKAAVMINSTKDLLTFYTEALKIKDEEKIILGMGAFGFNTRVLSGKINSYLTFSSKEGVSAAPGHVTPQLLKNNYRFKSINPETNIMGIIGNPVMHTKSPGIHNPGYISLGLDSVYVPFETDDIKCFMEIATLLDIKGFSVTVPFKVDIISCLDSVTNSVKMIGACNTVTKIADKWIGENTDYIGFINPLLKAYGSLKNKKVSVIGAGGSAKATLFALKEEGAEVLILNRTLEKAKELAELFNSEFAPLSSQSINKIKEYSDIIVQNTNVGMHPLQDINPLDFYSLDGSEFLYDVVYTPEVTRFLERGKESGCRILNGWSMLLEQGYRQFKLFTGLDYPIN